MVSLSFEEIAQTLSISVDTVERTRRRFVEGNLELEEEVFAWEQHRNCIKAGVNWMFALEDARKKMGHLYPKLLRIVERHVDAQLNIAM